MERLRLICDDVVMHDVVMHDVMRDAEVVELAAAELERTNDPGLAAKAVVEVALAADFWATESCRTWVAPVRALFRPR